jgi:hypothetical protein
MGDPEQGVVQKGVPSDLLPYLTSDEELVQTERTKKWRIYLTNKRFILKKGGIFRKELVEAAYRHISSIEYKKHRSIKLIVLGIICIALGFVLTYLFSFWHVVFWLSWLSIILAIVGVVIIVAGFLRPAKFRIHVVGRNPISLSGDLDEILKIIREYREK